MRRKQFISKSIKGSLKEKKIRSHIPDLYIPCPCGSGKKYKFCCYKSVDREFHNPNELYLDIVKKESKKEFCMYENQDCKLPIIKAHSIQNNKILSKLAVDGHVYVPSFNQKKFGGLDIKKCGKNEATIATCFCKYHDDVIFKDIDTKNYNYEEKQNFLYAYRAFSKYYYDRIGALESDRKRFKDSPNFMIANGGYERIKGLEKSVEENEEIRNSFNTALKYGKYDEIKSIVFTLDYEVNFATAYMSPLSFDLEGNLISDVWSLDGRIINIYVSIFPENGKSYILISWLKEDDSLKLHRYRQQFQEIKKEEILLRTLNNMVACQSDNFVFSKKLLDTWGEETMNMFLTQCMSTVISIKGRNIGQEIERNIKKYVCKFDLFLRI